MFNHSSLVTLVSLYVNHRTWDDKMSPFYADEYFINELFKAYGEDVVRKECKRQVWFRDLGYEPEN